MTPDNDTTHDYSPGNIPPEETRATLSVEACISALKNDFVDCATEATRLLKLAFRTRWNIDLDPQNTLLVMVNYNTGTKAPYPGKVTSSTTVTGAMLHNLQRASSAQGYLVPYYDGGPNIRLVNDLPRVQPVFYDFKSRFYPYQEKADITHAYEGLYRRTEPQVYNASTHINVSAEALKKLIWELDFNPHYLAFLDRFWTAHESNYRVLTKASLFKSAWLQFHEGTLTESALQLVMRTLGLESGRTWATLEADDLKQSIALPVDIETGLLNIHRYLTTDLLYIQDKNTHLTLLYIPGNSSPIHTFPNVSNMQAWLANQGLDPDKKHALAAHFRLQDLSNGLSYAGALEALEGLSSWPAYHNTPGGLFNYQHRAFSGYWNPQAYIQLRATHYPFAQITRRQKSRSYADANTQIISNRDVSKAQLYKGLEILGMALTFMLPISLLIPELALGIDLAFLAQSAAQVGVGIDDQAHGKSIGTRRIVFGVINASAIVTVRGAQVLTDTQRSTTGVATKILSPAPEEILPAAQATADMQRINIEGQTRYVYKNPNRMGSYELYEINPEHTDQMRTTGLFARQEEGQWKVNRILGGGGHSSKSATSVTQQFDFMDRYRQAGSDVEAYELFRKDARKFYKSATVRSLPPRPLLPSLGEAASTEQWLEGIYENTQGLVLGEHHNEIASCKVLVDYIDSFKRYKNMTFYVEGLHADRSTYRFAASRQVPEDVLRGGYGWPYTRAGVFTMAQNAGIRLIGLEHEVLTRGKLTGFWEQLFDVTDRERLKSFNYYAMKVIQQDIERHSPERWLAWVGLSHMKSSEGVLGLAEMLGGIGVDVRNGTANAPTYFGRPRAPYVDALMPDGDLRIDMNIEGLPRWSEVQVTRL